MSWKQDGDRWVSGEYVISPDGFDDTTGRLPRYVLRLRGTLIHTSDLLAQDPVTDCIEAAEFHRGVSREGARQRAAQIRQENSC